MANKHKTPSVWRLEFSYVGVLVGLFFFAMSLTPSLLPRGVFFQGVVSGVTMVIGYGLGLALQKIWLYLQLPTPIERQQRIINVFMQSISAIVLFIFLWKYVGWQNDVLAATGSDQTISAVSLFPIIIVSAILGYLVLVMSRTVLKFFNMIMRWFRKALPHRVANVIGIAVAAFLFINILNGVIIEGFFAVANQSFSVTDARLEEGINQPQVTEKSGSPNSLSPWEELGRQGRKFVSTGPSAEQIESFSGEAAEEPVRVYVGLNSADSIQGRADLALEELKRTGAFDREVLVVATTTGTGWLDPKAVDPLEYMHGGDTAIVGVQYSFLPSWISLFADQQIVKDTSTTVFSTIHDYWRQLPESERPEIYVYGLSLGSFGAESILSSINIVNEPLDGAIYSGPTLFNQIRNELTDSRDEGSPAWQPVIDEGRTVRFTAKENALEAPTAEWDETRIVYTQHATDPVTFFSFDLALNEPEWLLEGQRGPDLTDNMRWIPFVTFWQVAADLPTAGAVENGYGHNYSQSTMIDAWAGVTEPADWSQDKADALKKVFQ
jgi:uncharacterized membrane protein